MNKEVFSKSGEKSFTVRVSVRSKDRKTRVQKQRTGISTRAKAKGIEKELLRIAHEEVIKRENQGHTWLQLVDEWELYLRRGFSDGKPILKTTAQDNVSILRQYTGQWDKVCAAEITRGMVRCAIDDLIDRGKSRSRMKALKGSINCCFNWGIDTGRIKTANQSPAYGVKLPQQAEKEPEILNYNEIQDFLVTAKVHEPLWYPIWAFALLTGMRSGEIYALEWSDIDFESRRIMVSKSYNKRLGGVKSTKAGYWREVPINDELEKFLREVSAQTDASGHVFPRIRSWERGDAARELRKFCSGHGLKPIKFHTLRSCFATQLIKNGIAPAIVMKLCGWRDLGTMQRYIRLAGIEVSGATEGLKFISPKDALRNVVSLLS